MKKTTSFYSILILCFLTQHVQAQKASDSVYLFCYFKNNGADGLHLAYSMDGYNWTSMFNDSAILKPQISNDKLMRDPCIIRGGDGNFHMVWTVSWADKGIGYASSPDLIHWSEQKYIPVMEDEPATLNAWAPEITYDEDKRKYILYWASSIKDRFPQKDTSAEGKKYNHRIYYTTTKNFKKFDKTKVLYDPGFSVIDATIKQDGDQYVMFLKNETKAPAEKNLRVAFSKDIDGPYSAAGPSITGKNWAEGPTALKINGRWIVYFDKYTEHKYGAVQSTDLIHWEDVSNKVYFPKGTRHGTAFAISKKEFDKLNAAQ